MKAKTRGQPPGKINISTRRNPSTFELVLSVQDSYSPLLTGTTNADSGGVVQAIQKRQSKEKVSCTVSIMILFVR